MGGWILFDIILSIFIDKVMAVICGFIFIVFAIFYGIYIFLSNDDDSEDESYDSYEEY